MSHFIKISFKFRPVLCSQVLHGQLAVQTEMLKSTQDLIRSLSCYQQTDKRTQLNEFRILPGPEIYSNSYIRLRRIYRHIKSGQTKSVYPHQFLMVGIKTLQEINHFWYTIETPLLREVKVSPSKLSTVHLTM